MIHFAMITHAQTLHYINDARTKPSKFAQYVKKELGTFISEYSIPLIPGCNYKTNEGKGAWTEAYNFLMNQPPLPPLIYHEGLTLAAEDHVVDLAQHSIFGHEGSDDRIKRRCGQAYGSSSQNIGSEFSVNGRNHDLQIVLGLIIDDGFPSRGHRQNIFSKVFKYVGISSRVQGDKIITVMDFHSQDLALKNSEKHFDNAINCLQCQNNGNLKESNKGGLGLGYNDGLGELIKNLGCFSGQSNKENQKKITYGKQKIEVSRYLDVSTQTVNGVRKTFVTCRIKYSDGSEEELSPQTFMSVQL